MRRLWLMTLGVFFRLIHQQQEEATAEAKENPA